MARFSFDLADTLAVVADEGTLDAASRRLHVSPSAVSQRIKALEEQIGRVLLVRSKPVRLTEAGATVVRLARQAALLEHDAATALGLPAAGTPAVGEADAPVAGADMGRAVMPLAVNADSLATWFLAPLGRLAERHPVVFDLHRDDQDFTAGFLESGTVMAAVTSRAEPVAGCRVSHLGAMRYRAVAAPRFAQRWFAGGVDAAALARAPVVDFDRRDELQSRWLRGQGVDVARPPRHRVPASHDFAEAVYGGLGWAMLPAMQSDDALLQGRLVPLGGDPVDVPLYWQQWNLRSPLLDVVAAEIVAEGRRVLPPTDPGAEVSRR